MKPEGWHNVTPRFVAHDSRHLVEFLKQVFAAKGDYRTDAPTILTIGDSMIMISEAGERSATSSFLYVYVADADQTYRCAIEAGATSLEQPLDTPYGDRRAMIR